MFRADLPVPWMMRPPSSGNNDFICIYAEKPRTQDVHWSRLMFRSYLASLVLHFVSSEQFQVGGGKKPVKCFRAVWKIPTIWCNHVHSKRTEQKAFWSQGIKWSSIKDAFRTTRENDWYVKSSREKETPLHYLLFNLEHGGVCFFVLGFWSFSQKNQAKKASCCFKVIRRTEGEGEGSSQ